MSNLQHENELKLQNDWKIYYQRTLDDKFVEIGSFSTVQEFWSFFNFIKISSIHNGSILSVVKKLKDNSNSTTEHLEIDHCNSRNIDLNEFNEDLGSLWIKVLVFLIGEQVTQTEYILGSSFKKCSNENDIIELKLIDSSKFDEIENDLKEKLKKECYNDHIDSPLINKVNKSVNIQFKEPIIEDDSISPYTDLTRYEKKKQFSNTETFSSNNFGKEDDSQTVQSSPDSEKIIEKKRRRRNRSRGSRSKYVERNNNSNNISPNKEYIPLKADLPTVVEMIQNSDVYKYNNDIERNVDGSNHVTISKTLIRNSSFQSLNVSEQSEIEKKHKRKRSRSSKKKFAFTFTTEHIIKILLIITLLIFSMALYNFSGKITFVYECQK